MKNILFLTITLLIFNNAKSQTDTIAINNTFDTSQTIYSFTPNQTIYGLKINGSISYGNNTSLARVILVSNDSTEFLIYEAYPCLYNYNGNGSFSFSKAGDETYYLDSIDASYIKIETINAKIEITTMLIDTTYNSNIPALREQYVDSLRQNKIDSINNNLQKYKLLWVAADNPIAQLDYNQKKIFFGEKYNIEGYEYYYGGIFSFFSDINEQRSIESNSLIDNFDWRKRHGANNPNSPYWDGDPDYQYQWPNYYFHETGNGWITSIKDQQNWSPCPKGCFVFGPLGAIEAVTNLYFNQNLDFDLSEQHVLSCYPAAGNCYADTGGGGWEYMVLKFARDSGIVNQSCFPWNPQISIPNGGPGTPPCNLCASPDSKIKIDSYHSFNNTQMNDYDVIKDSLINHGPLSTSLYKPGGHAMALVGYGKVEEEDTLYTNYGWGSPGFIIVPSGSPLIGETYWIFKQSYFTTFGINGYVHMITKQADPSAPEFLRIQSVGLPIVNLLDNSLDVLCKDLDGDGYFWWGIGPKPNTCPLYSPDVEDCDDSDPLVGPYDNAYNCTPICEYDNSWTEITTNTTIEYNQYLTTNIKVKNGYTLKIMSGATLYIHPSSQIVVESGGILYLDNGNIKVCSDAAWQGSLSIDLGGQFLIENESEYYINN